MFTSIVQIKYFLNFFNSQKAYIFLIGDMIESVQRRVSIQSVEPEVMQQLVDYVYTSEICITQVFCFVLLP